MPKTSPAEQRLLAFGGNQRASIAALGTGALEFRARAPGAYTAFHPTRNQRDGDIPSYKWALHCPAPKTIHPSLLRLQDWMRNAPPD
jgi:hypothetical protein